jgi:hypothetical protein
MCHLCTNSGSAAEIQRFRAYGGEVRLSVAVQADRDGFRAEVQQLPGCVAGARTLAELGGALERAVSIRLGDPALTLLYVEMAPGEVIASAVPGSLECWHARKPT